MEADTLWKLAPLATGVAGYIGGILSEPIKAALKRRQETSALRRSIYAELLRNLDVIENAVERARKERDYFSKYNPFPDFMTFECYEYVKKNQPITFNFLPEATTINMVYAVMRSFTNAQRDPEHLRAYAEDTKQAAVRLILGGALDPFLLRAVDPKRGPELPFARRALRRIRQIARTLRGHAVPVTMGDLNPIQPPRSALREYVAAARQEIAAVKDELERLPLAKSAETGLSADRDLRS